MVDLESLAAAIGWLNEQRLTQPHELHRRLNTLETFMTATDDKIAALAANLANIQADVQRLSDLAVSIQAQTDAATAVKLQPLVDLSAQIAARTPEPVVPTP